MIPLSVPNLSGNELKYVTEAINSSWVSNAGSYVNRFEKDLADYAKVNHSVAVQSGTAGLHLAMIAQGINHNHEVLVPTLTFIAAVNPVKYVGAEPIFMDCDDSLCIDPIKLEEFLTQECYFEGGNIINKKTKKQIKAIVVVHVFGNMADMEKLMEIAERFGLIVVEDATEALGTYYTQGTYKGKHAGTIGHVGVYSFNGNKIITTGGGGMVVSNNNQTIQKIRYLSTQAKNDDLNYIHHSIGYNYRMTNVQAAIGVAQLEQLESFISIKRNNYIVYKERLNQTENYRVLTFRDSIRPNYWFYAIQLCESFSITKEELLTYLYSKGIQSRPIWGLISDQKPYLNSQKYKIDKAGFFWNRVLNLPCSSNLDLKDVEYITDCLNAISK